MNMRILWSSLIIMTVMIMFTLSISVQAENRGFRARAHHLQEAGYGTGDDLDAELMFGRNLAARILGQFKLYENPEVVDYFASLGAGLSGMIGRSELNYYFAIMNSDDINGYAAPGGYIFVTKGAIKIMDDEAQLVGVLAHEMSHVNRFHTVKELKLRGKDSAITAGLAAVIMGGDQSLQIIFGKLMDKGVSILFKTGLPKDDEFEADADAVKTLASLGYDPQSYYLYLEKLSKEIQEDNKKGRYLSSTHPKMADRLESLKKIIEQQHLKTIGGKKNEKRFTEMVSHL